MADDSTNNAHHVSLDSGTNNTDSGFTSWVKTHPGITATAIVLIVALIGTGTYFAFFNDQPYQDVVASRDSENGHSQEFIPEAKVIKGAGKGTITTVDNEDGGKIVSAPLVGIDAVGTQDGAELRPPERIDTVGWYVRSAKPYPPGSNAEKKQKGSVVMTSHINYNGVTGIGALFTSLKKGDPLTVTNSEGIDTHYVVETAPYLLEKQDPKYTEKTKNTINDMTSDTNKLVLITCSGNYVGGALGYDSNSITVLKPVAQLPNEDIKKFE